MTWVAGVDGCPAGWLVVLADADGTLVRYKVVDHISAVIGLSEAPKVIAIDIPIGLPDSAKRGGRECDRLARGLLGHPRASSVFSPPVRPALIEKDYPRALQANRNSSDAKIGISKQCFGLFEKMRQVDDCLNSNDTSVRERIREVHPELCFLGMNGRPMDKSKKNDEGIASRRELLEKEGFGPTIVSVLSETRRKDVAKDDILDACAASWSAMRILKGNATVIPGPTELDRKGLRMAMWY